MDLIQLAQVALPALVGLVAAQKAPDKLLPVPASPETPMDKMTVVGAAIVLLGVVSAIQTNDPSKIDPVQLVAALGVVYGLLPRAHELFDRAVGLFKKSPV